jgi:hypothetical protein
LVGKSSNKGGDDLIDQIAGWGNISDLYYDTRFDHQLDFVSLSYTQNIECWVDGILQGTGAMTVTSRGITGQFTDNDTLGTTVRFSSTRIRDNHLVDFEGTRVTVNPRSSRNIAFTIDSDTKQCVAGDCDLVPTPLVGHILDVAASSASQQQQRVPLCLIICGAFFLVCLRRGNPFDFCFQVFVDCLAVVCPLIP